MFLAVTYGFYNSQNHDRRYNAEQFSRIFNLLIKDGVFSHVGGKLMVSSASPAAMRVVVGTGFAWFSSTWTNNDANLVLEVFQANPIYPRIDTVVLEVDSTITVRANSIKIVQGTPSSNPVAPTLINTDTIHQYPLADIYIRSGATEITPTSISNRVGTTATPFVTGILETADLTDLFTKWELSFSTFLEEQTTLSEQTFQNFTNLFNTQLEEYHTTFTESYDSWRDEFETWFEGIQTALEGDVAANLAGQINTLQLEFNNFVNNNIQDLNDIRNRLTALESGGVVKTSDKATVAEAVAGTPNKWIDGQTFLQAVNQLVTDSLQTPA